MNIPSLMAYTITTPSGVPLTFTVWGLVRNALGVILPLSAILFVLVFVYAGISYISSTGDMQKVKSAQSMMTNAIYGFIIVVSAFFILQLVNYAITGSGVPGL